jgi:hypothetical protein
MGARRGAKKGGKSNGIVARGDSKEDEIVSLTEG